MKQTINLSAFRDAFRRCDRQDQFSYEAQELLFDYLEDMDEDYDLDVIAICCEYSESDFEDVAEQYSIDIEDMDEDEIQDAVREYLNENTCVIGETRSTIIYAQF